jgi:hypothetical protein
MTMTMTPSQTVAPERPETAPDGFPRIDPDGPQPDGPGDPFPPDPFPEPDPLPDRPPMPEPDPGPIPQI